MNDLLSVTLRTIFGGMVRGRVCVHGFAAPIEATGRGHRGLDLSLTSGRYDSIGSPVSGPLRILRDGETRARRSVEVLIDVGLRRVRVLVACGQRSGRRGLLRNGGGRNRRDVVNVHVQVGGSLLLLLLRLIVALLLKGHSECRKDGLKVSLERLS